MTADKPDTAISPGRARSAAASSLSAPSAVVGRNARLQHLRGFAAILVLLFHCSDYLQQLRGEPRFIAIFTPFFGTYGVAVFFVLSGYLMSRLSLRDEPHRFLLDRILRIYPLMLIVVAIAVAGYWVTGYTRRPDLVALTLVPAGPRNYLLGIEWTLLIEMTFYVIIALAMMTGLRQRLNLLFVGWLVVLLAASLTGLSPEANLTPTIRELFSQTANSAFLLGFLLPGLLDARWLPGPKWLAAAALPIACLVLVLPAGAERWIAGLSSLLLVAAALKASPVSPDGLGYRIGLRLGDASYALYLCHVPIILISGAALPATLPTWSFWLGWAATSIAAALLLGRLDVSLHERLKRATADKPRKRIMAVSLAFMAAFIGIALAADFDARAKQAAVDRARTVLDTATPRAWPTVLAGIDSSAILKDGRLVLRGYGIDLAAPDDDAHVAVRQGGRLIGFDRMTRMRPQTAKEANRPDLTSIRFGFGVVTDQPLRCDAGSLSAVVVVPSGKVAPVVSPVLDAVCPHPNAVPSR